MRRVGLLAVLVTLFLLAPFAERAEAGIIVTREGKVIVGRIVREEITEEGVWVHWPYKERRERAKFFFEKRLIRWFDPDLDEPSNKYWDDFSNESIELAFLPLRDRYLGSKQKGVDPNMKLFFDSMRDSRARVRLSAMPLSVKAGPTEVLINKPEGWIKDEWNGILMFVSDVKGEKGYTPRIHVYSVPSIQNMQASDQVALIRKELITIAGSADNYESKDEDGPKVVRGGPSYFDYKLTTTIRRTGGDSVTALRKVFFRTNRTYFFTAYAHEKDFQKYGLFFSLCLDSMKIKDGSEQADPGEGDKPGEKPGEKAGDKPAEQPGEKPGEKPGTKPEEKPGDKPK